MEDFKTQVNNWNMYTVKSVQKEKKQAHGQVKRYSKSVLRW